MKIPGLTLLFLTMFGTTLATENGLRSSLAQGNGNSNGRGNGNGNGRGNGNGNGGDNGNDGDQVEELIIEEIDDPTDNAPEMESPNDSRSNDIGLISDASGWSPDQVEILMDLQDKFKSLVGDVSDHPMFGGSEMPSSPGGEVKLMFKNGLPPGLEDKVKEFESETGVAVDRASIRHTLQEQENRGKRMQNKLEAKGFRNIGYAMHGDKLLINANRPVGDDSINVTPPGRGKLPVDQADDVAIEILKLNDGDDDAHGLQLDIHEVSTHMDIPQFSRGGRKIYGGGYECTASFTVRSRSTGEMGICDAAHCNGMNTFDSEAPISDVSMSFRGEHIGTYGDFEWHATADTEVAQYWANPTTLRSVTGWDSYPSVNEWVCVYSRMQGTRTCTQIAFSSVTVNYSGLPPAGNMVAASGHNTVAGDSGGPWSWGTTAYGVHSGSGTYGGQPVNFFSRIYYVQDILGVDILTQ